MTTTRWAGLLRAVNVGGRKLTMADVRSAVEAAGYTDVATLLASGNVVFGTDQAASTLRPRLEAAISERAGFAVEVLLRSKGELEAVLATNPFADGRPAQVLVGFLDDVAPPGLEAALRAVAVRERVKVDAMQVWLDCVDGIGRSAVAAKLPSLVRPRIVTARNVNTVGKLAALL